MISVDTEIPHQHSAGSFNAYQIIFLSRINGCVNFLKLPFYPAY